VETLNNNGRKSPGGLTMCLPHFLFQIYHQIKKHGTITNDVTKSLDKTLEAFQNVEDAIVDIKTQRNVMKDKTKIADYDKILVQLEKASDDLISAIALFQKHEGSL
jgi:imidazoleglycerol phosphate dehydratase HisB